MVNLLEISKSLTRLNLPLLCILFVASIGCKKATHVSSAHGPHGGHVFLMPDGANLELELTLDDRGKRMIVYSQSTTDQQPFALQGESLKANFQAGSVDFDTTLAAHPRPSDPDGHSSRFAIGFNKLPQQLLSADEFHLTLWCPMNGETLEVSLFHKNDHGHKYRHD